MVIYKTLVEHGGDLFDECIVSTEMVPWLQVINHITVLTALSSLLILRHFDMQDFCQPKFRSQEVNSFRDSSVAPSLYIAKYNEL